MHKKNRANRVEHMSGRVRILHGQNAKSGETLAEVMVSVVIFLLLVALLQGSVAFCTNAQQKSRQIRENTSDAIEAYWKASDANTLKEDIMTTIKDDGTEEKLKNQVLAFKAGTGTTVFTVNVDLKKKIASYDDTDGDGKPDKTVTFYTYGVVGTAEN